jgi:hypothetical protein
MRYVDKSDHDEHLFLQLADKEMDKKLIFTSPGPFSSE